MQLWWIQIELFRLKGTGAGWEKDHWFVFLCPSFKLWDDDNSKGETEVTIYHSLQHATNQHFCFPCVLCMSMRESYKGEGGWKKKVYFNPDLINAL